jgi:hypothetical protein
MVSYEQFKQIKAEEFDERERMRKERDDERIADRTRRHSVDDVVYKTIEQPAQARPVTSTQQINDLDPAVQARWDAWFDARFKERLLDALDEEIGEEFVHFDEGHEALEKIRADIATLRAEFTTLQAVVKGDVAPLPLVRRVTRDDAA